jgi:hypothetical protein
MKIDLFTFLSKNSSDYAEFLKYTCDIFASGNHEINWKCIESVGCDRIPKGYKLVAKAEDMKYSSMNHARALNLAQNYIESDYVIFIDADMVILYKNWDQVIINELNRYDCFGGAFGNRLRKYRSFPSVYLFAFRSHILNKVKLDFLPKLTKDKRHIYSYRLNEEDAGYYNMKSGKTIHCDTGWRLPFVIKKAGLTYNVMDAVCITSKNIQLHFENIQQEKICMEKPKHMSEWHYNGKLFASHKHASTRDDINSERGNAWKRRIELYIKNYKEEII